MEEAQLPQFSTPEEFWTIVESEAEKHNLHISSDFRELFDDLIIHGLNTMRAREKATERSLSPGEVQNIHKSLRQLARALALETLRRGERTIHAGVFENVKRQLCPGLWPFC